VTLYKIRKYEHVRGWQVECFSQNEHVRVWQVSISGADTNHVKIVISQHQIVYLNTIGTCNAWKSGKSR